MAGENDKPAADERVKGFTVKEVTERIGRGEPIPSGWTFDPRSDPPVRKATADELANAEG